MVCLPSSSSERKRKETHSSIYSKYILKSSCHVEVTNYWRMPVNDIGIREVPIFIPNLLSGLILWFKVHDSFWPMLSMFNNGLASSAFARHYSRNLVDFFSSAYLDVSLRQVPLVNLLIQLTIHGSSPCWFPNSEIPGSLLIYSSPRLIAVSHVLLRLLMPRHSPYALFRLNFLNRFLQSVLRCPSSQIIFTVVFSPYFAFLAKFVVIFTPLRKDLLIFFFIPFHSKE